MKRKLDLTTLPHEGLTVTPDGPDRVVLTLPAVESARESAANDASGMQRRPRGRFLLRGEPGRLGGVDWQGMRYLVMDIRSEAKADPGMAFEYWNGGRQEGSSDLTAIVGLLPVVTVRLAFPLEACDGSQLFWMPRTPGRLKMVVHGNRIYPEECRQMSFGFYRLNFDQHIAVSGVYLTDEEPDYPLEPATLLDELGQWAGWSWPGKTAGAEELTAHLRARAALPDRQFGEGLSPYGGWLGKRFKATGWFRTVQADGRWWMADPDGCAYFSAGLDCVGTRTVQTELASTRQWIQWLPEQDGPFASAFDLRLFEGYVQKGKPLSADFFSYDRANLIRAFGEEWFAKGVKVLRDYMLEWGFNSFGNWCELDVIRAAKLPYVWPLRDFPDRMIDKKIFRDFPDVFSPQFTEEAERYAQQLEEFRDDRLMIGYFMRNEPEWAFVEDICIAEELLENHDDCHSKAKFIEWVGERYGNQIAAFNEAWGLTLPSFGDLRKPIRRARRLSAQATADLNAFSALLIDRYVRLPAEALRRVDPHHMNLGMRYAYVDNPILLTGCDVFDVFSVNCYQMDPGEEMDRLGEMTGLPTMIGEYHFGALDRGLPATGLKAVAGQAERGQAYRCYVESAASSHWCLGAHYFTLSDQSALGRFDGENYQIGLMDVCFRPYEECVRAIRVTHDRLYQVMSGETPAFADRPTEHEIVAF